MKKRNKKLNRQQKRDLGMSKPSGKSKYELKKQQQAKGNFSPGSPFKLITDDKKLEE